jgi:aminomuconate-semialdehyde/2-hydroxymuconate-6-semialdehyde dehydrogenase
VNTNDFSALEKQITAGGKVPVPEFLTKWLSRWKRLYIDGAWRDGTSGETFPTINPATGEELSEICVAVKPDVELAVQGARRAFDKGDWRQMSVVQRAEVLRKIAERILAHRAPLAILESLDTGKPIRESFDGDVPRAAKNFLFFADQAAGFGDRTFESEGYRHQVIREPLGVVALITPWNLPLYLETWKLAPALLMGNSVILKPSELTPLTATYLGEIIEGLLPPGVFNLLHGFGEAAVGEFLTSNPGVDAISFTGETSTGRAIMKAAAAGPTRVSFELGGKGASIVFADAPWESVLTESVRGAFRNQGEICLANSRIYVERSRYPEFLAALVERTARIKVGDPLDYHTEMGALISEGHLNKVKGYLEKVFDPGRIDVGGKTPAHCSPKGFFLEPTVISEVDQAHSVTREEIFGPVVSVYPFDDEATVTAWANATPYGLSASVWTADAAKAKRVATALRSGLVWVNSWFVRDLRVPFGGQKRSGLGREGGDYSLSFFSDYKSICMKDDMT